MSARIFLNELKTDERRLAPAEPGRWKADGDFLAKFESDIYVTGEVADRIVNSVPSVFARPIQFRQALFDSAHPMHRTVRNQWRGLLALFALRKALGIQMSTTPFAMRDAEEIRKDDSDRQFALILRNQCPRPAEEWRNWLLLYCQGQLVGATSPWTMAYTPAGYRVEQGVTWIDANGLLDDPFQYLYEAGDRNEELAVLNAWLVQVLAKYPWGMSTDPQGDAGKLKVELDRWRQEIDVRVKARPDAKNLISNDIDAPSPYGVFFSAIDVLPLRTMVQSDLRLDDLDQCNVVVLSRTALQNPQMKRKRVDGSVRVEDLDLQNLPGPEGPAGWRSKTGTEIPKPYVIAEEYFLADRIFRIPVTEHAASAGTREYALPLTPAFVKHFGTANLDQIVSIEPSADRVTVRLRLPLTNGEILAIEKKYQTSTNVESLPEGTLIPELAVWPDFYDSAWSDNEAILAQASPNARTQQIFFAPLYADGTSDSAFTVRENTPGVCVWRCAKPPLGFAISVRDGSGRRVDAGLIVRANTQAPRVYGLSWNVGVDFGTSNTHVMLKTVESERSLILTGRALPLVRASELNTLAFHEATHHPGTVAPPFPTLLRRANVTTIAAGTGTEITRGVIAPKVNVAAVASNAESYVRDIKWSADVDAQKQYLEQLARMIVTEARAAGATRLNFEWSYPLSLPARIRSTMETFWSSIGNVHSRAGLTVTSGTGITESDALCRCVASNEMLPILAGNLSISIDIGGGSTDIGFWSDKTLIDRLSFNLAGNDIVRLAAGYDTINSALLTMASGVEIAGDFRLDAFRSQPEIVWNALLNAAASRTEGSRHAPYAHPFVNEMGRTSSVEWRKCRTAVMLAFGGVFFYTGVHSGRHLKPASAGVTLYLGGKGSALLSWLGRAERVRDILQQHFTAGFALGSNNAKVGLELYGPAVSGGPEGRIGLKDEVANGLLEGDALKAALGSELDLNSTVVGEVNWVDDAGQELPWNTLVAAGKLARLNPPANDNSSFAAYFLKQVLRPMADANDLDVDGLQKLQVNQNWTINAIRKRADEQVMQPIFAYELKSVIRRYAEISAPTRS